MKEFVDNLDRINNLAGYSPGFVWRLKDDSNSATGFHPYDDHKIIINVSVWEDIASPERFTYKTVYAYFIKKERNGSINPET